jgi:hypothetical protein
MYLSSLSHSSTITNEEPCSLTARQDHLMPLTLQPQ